MQTDKIIFAEIKPFSPAPTFVQKRTWEECYDIAKEVARRVSKPAFSVLVDPLWKGEDWHLEKVREENPEAIILAKGVHNTDKQIDKYESLGADFVLAVDFIPTVHQEKCLIEMCDFEKLLTVPKHMWKVWNARDLRALLEHRAPEKRMSFHDVRQSVEGKLVQASHLRTIHDVHPQADAVIVGSNIDAFLKSIILTDALP